MAITNHAVDKNHVIGWDEARTIGTEENRYKRWVKEAIEIRKRRGKTMNRDEGHYQLSHVYDEFLVKPGLKSQGNNLATLPQHRVEVFPVVIASH